MKALLTVVLCASLLTAGCSHPKPPVVQATIGGTVSGLQGSGLVAPGQSGETPSLTPPTAAFTFATSLATRRLLRGDRSESAENHAQPDVRGVAEQRDGAVAERHQRQHSMHDQHLRRGGDRQRDRRFGARPSRTTGGDSLPVSANGAFAFATPVSSGSAYAVTVTSQPTAPSQMCVVSSGGGTIDHAAVTQVSVVCAGQPFTIGGTVTGVLGSGLALADNGGDALAISANGAFTFPTPVASGQTYVVTVKTQPSSAPVQTCTVSGGEEQSPPAACPPSSSTTAATSTPSPGTSRDLRVRGRRAAEQRCRRRDPEREWLLRLRDARSERRRVRSHGEDSTQPALADLRRHRGLGQRWRAETSAPWPSSARPTRIQSVEP